MSSIIPLHNSSSGYSVQRCDSPQGHRLDVRNLTVNYGPVLALEDVSLSTHCGRAVGVVGPNGAGKSTLLKSMAGLTSPDSGAIIWHGEPMARSTSEIAYLAQRSEVDWNFPLTVRGLVEMGRYSRLGWWRRFRSLDKEVVDAALDSVAMTDLADRRIGELSGGQQQRAFIARALAQEAHVFLFDEPFSGLDQPARENLSEIISELTKSGRLVIATHHDLDTVEDLFDEVLLVKTQLIAYGPVETVFTPENLETAFGPSRLRETLLKSKLVA